MSSHTLIIITANGCGACENMKKIGCLDKIIQLFKKNKINVKHINNPQIGSSSPEYTQLTNKGMAVSAFPSFIGLKNSLLNSNDRVEGHFYVYDIGSLKGSGKTWDDIPGLLLNWFTEAIKNPPVTINTQQSTIQPTTQKPKQCNTGTYSFKTRYKNKY